MKRAAVSLVFVVGCRFELPQAAPVDALPVDTPGCPANYAPLPGGPSGHLYRKVQDGEWAEQFDICRGTAASAYLAVPNNATELMNLFALAGAPFWVGINDQATEGDYVSVETGGPATFLPWGAGEPDGATSPTEDCVVALTSAVISDESCFFSVATVCECNP